MTSSQGNGEAEGYLNQGYDINSKSSLLFKEKWYDEEDGHNLSSSSKILLPGEGPGSIVKISTMMIVDQARIDTLEYKLVSKGDY